VRRIAGEEARVKRDQDDLDGALAAAKGQSDRQQTMWQHMMQKELGRRREVAAAAGVADLTR